MRCIFRKLLLFGLLLLASCGKAPSHKPSSLRFSMQRDMTTLDPQKGSDVATSTVHCLLFEGLMRPKTDNSVEPALAESIQISPDGLKYTFILKKSRWSDGTPLTAYDFERSWKRLVTPDFPASNTHLLYPIKNAEAIKKGLLPVEKLGATALDAHTFVVELEQPTPYFLEMISFPCFHPVKDSSQNPKHLLSTGAYTIKKWKFNNHITLKKNPFYWDASSVQSDTIEIFIIDNENTALNMFEKNQLDFIGGSLMPLPLDALKSLQSDVRLKIAPVAGSTVCFFNTQAFPFNNQHLRKAFSYAISSEEILETLAQGSPAATVVPPILKKEPLKPALLQDQERLAQQHLAKALEELHLTLSDLNHLTYLYSGRQEHHHTAQILQARWKKILGITIQLHSVEHKVLLERLKTKDFDFGQTTWLAQYNDPLAILERFRDLSSSKNYSGWSNARFAACLEKSYLAEGKNRLLLLEEAEKILAEAAPLVPLYHWNYAFLIHDNVKNISFTPLGTINFSQIRVERSFEE